MPRISISYRRADTQAITGRIYDRLRDHYGVESVFIDIDAIPLGTNYKDHISETLRQTDFLLVVVGEKWLGPRANGTYRISDLNDPVRLELQAAMQHQRKIIPLLADGASMPGPEELPEDLREFSFINGAEIDSGRYFDVHISSVMKFLDSAIAKQAAASSELARTEEEALAEQQRLAEEAAKLAEQQRQAEEAAKLAEQQRQAEETAKLTEQRRRAEEAAKLTERQRQSEDAAKLAERQRQAEKPEESSRGAAVADGTVQRLMREWRFVELRAHVAIAFGIGTSILFFDLGLGTRRYVTNDYCFDSYIIVAGIVALAQAIHLRNERAWWPWFLCEGIVGVLAGALMLQQDVIEFNLPSSVANNFDYLSGRVPGAILPTGNTYNLTIVAWFFLMGILQVVLATRLRRLFPKEIFLVLAGAASIVTGMAAKPFLEAIYVGNWLSLFLGASASGWGWILLYVAYEVVFGILLLRLASRLKRSTAISNKS
jgi:uncharacterized membrane protein HdeD (DUF308 family)